MPALSFEDYEVAHMVEPRCVPFTCIDYRLGKDAGKKLLEDSEKGAYALKLHPILSKRALDDPLTEEALRYWAETGKPVTSHCGAGMYYYPEINDQYATPEFGDLAHLVECIAAEPRRATSSESRNCPRGSTTCTPTHPSGRTRTSSS